MSAKVLLQQWWWIQPPHLRGSSAVVLSNGVQGPIYRLPRRLVSLLSISVRCGYSQKPPDFSVDYDPFEDFFGLGIDMKTRKQAEDTDDSLSSYGEYRKMVPCPVCRGRGYVLDSPKGPNLCIHCIGKGMVLEDSVWESAWETNQTRSPLRVDDDDALDKIDPDEPQRPEKRVYGPRPEAVRQRISRTLKELERRTGALSKRAKRQHRNPKIHSRMAAAIKRAKNTDAARMKVSQNQKLFFQNPENRRMRGLQMKGVKYSCKHCGKEGHRRHFCPELGFVKKVPRSEADRVYRCGVCRQVGHTRRQCPQRHPSEISGGSGVEAGDTELPLKHEDEGEEQQRRRGAYKCGHCHQLGHTRRTCPHLRQHQE
ncbi:hypothetical protein KC19_5G047400 [Ceratodon purpureus]|uniref:CCHC-type domain-containing protein n=1 Tax=Ceratodon purpureus TaxID=3225 RepID=A0A8T0HZ95_CERPU|nr:hypothetical protein KC19_5G047400 [Ceratodon purpureus]